MDKKAITEEIIKGLKLDLPLEKALAIFWWPDSKPTNKTNLRLTKAGMKALMQLMTPYEFKYKVRPTGNALKQLIKIQSPFYVDFQGTVTVFGDQLASVIILYGSFDRYMEMISQQA